MRRIGILSGGVSGERYLSLQSGEHIAATLAGTGRYETWRIDWQQSAHWALHAPDGPVSAEFPSLPQLLSALHFDCLLNAFHGHEETDGHIAALLELCGVPFVGNGFYASAVAMDKQLTNLVLGAAGLPVMRGILLEDRAALSEEAHAELRFPCVAKPVSSGSSLGVSLSQNSAELASHLESAREQDFPYLVEPFVRGKEYAVAVAGRGNECRGFLPVEVQYAGEYFSAECKAAGSYRIVQAELPQELCAQLKAYAQEAHRLLRATALTRTDFIVEADGTTHILEVNASPGLSEHSIVPAQLALAGVSFADFLEEMIGATL